MTSRCRCCIRARSGSMYDLGGDLLMVASDRISTYDAVHPTPIPDKGKVLTGLSVFWFGLTQRHRPQPLRARHRRRAGRVPRARPAGAQARRCCRSSASCAATSPGRAGRTTRRTGTVSGIDAAGRACRSPSSSRSRSTRRRRRPKRVTTRRSTSTETVKLLGQRGLAAQVRDVSIEVYKAVAEHARERGVILADTKFEFGLDEEGVLTLGDEVCTPDSSRSAGRPYAVVRASPLRQAVRARLGDGQRLGQEPARAGDPGGHRHADPRAVRDGLRAASGEPFGAWLDRVA